MAFLMSRVLFMIDELLIIMQLRNQIASIYFLHEEPTFCAIQSRVIMVLTCTNFSMVAHLLIHKRQFCRSEVVLADCTYRSLPMGPA